VQASEGKNRSQKHLLRAEGCLAEAENRRIVLAVLQAVAIAVSQQRNHTFNKFVHLTDLISVLVLRRYFWKQSRKDQCCARHPGHVHKEIQNNKILRNSVTTSLNLSILNLPQAHCSNLFVS